MKEVDAMDGDDLSGMRGGIVEIGPERAAE